MTPVQQLTYDTLLDDFERSHLETWLEKDCFEDERDEIRGFILDALQEDPEVLNWASWPEIAQRGSP